MSRGAIYVSESGNSKISGSGKVDASYVSIKGSCPNSCPLKDEGCYAQTSYVGMINKRLNSRARQDSPLQLARSEAKAIDESYNGGAVPAGRDLRVHVSGDSRTIAGTRVINRAVARWKARGGGAAWSYTHAFKHVNRSDWSNVSVLASVSNVSEVEIARKNGYASAIVVPKHLSDKTYKLPNSDVKWIPCVQQTKNVPCVKCRLCFDADRLLKGGFGIAFEAHGARKNVVKIHLRVVQ